MVSRLGVAVTALVLGWSLSGCGSSAPASSAAPSTTEPAASRAAAAPSASAPSTPIKASANEGSEEEIFQALSRAGVPNPKRWTDEVIEYRPYPADDPNLGKLRQKLAKYNPGQETVDKIVSALKP